MLDLIITVGCGLFIVISGGVWAAAIRFALEATTGTVLPWRASVMAALLLFAVARPLSVEEDESLADIVGRLAPFGIIKPLLIAAAAWVLS